MQDKSESSENECNKKDEYESPASSTGWTGFNGSGSVAMTGHLAGLLAQNGQNGGSSSVNILFYLKYELFRLQKGKNNWKELVQWPWQKIWLVYGQNGGSWFVNIHIVSLQSFTPNTQFVPQKGKITT